VPSGQKPGKHIFACFCKLIQASFKCFCIQVHVFASLTPVFASGSKYENAKKHVFACCSTNVFVCSNVQKNVPGHAKTCFCVSMHLVVTCKYMYLLAKTFSIHLQKFVCTCKYMLEPQVKTCIHIFVHVGTMCKNVFLHVSARNVNMYLIVSGTYLHVGEHANTSTCTFLQIGTARENKFLRVFKFGSTDKILYSNVFARGTTCICTFLLADTNFANTCKNKLEPLKLANTCKNICGRFAMKTS
jgi:hypothetical protein